MGDGVLCGASSAWTDDGPCNVNPELRREKDRDCVMRRMGVDGSVVPVGCSEVGAMGETDKAILADDDGESLSESSLECDVSRGRIPRLRMARGELRSMDSRGDVLGDAE